MNLFKRFWGYFKADDHIDAITCVYRAPESLEMELAKTNNLAKLKSALVSGEIDPNASYLWNQSGHPLLGYAVGMNRRDVVRLLLVYKGVTPVMKAFGLGREEIAKDLVEAGGDPYLKDNQGHTACDYAKMNKNDFMLGLIGQKVNAEESDDLGD